MNFTWITFSKIRAKFKISINLVKNFSKFLKSRCMKSLSHKYAAENRNHLFTFLVLIMLSALIARISISCTGVQDQTLNAGRCDIEYLSSDLPGDSLNIQIINDNHANLKWEVLNESVYAKFNRRHELWYRILPRSMGTASPMLIMMAYTKGFEVFSANNRIYTYPDNDSIVYLKTHVIPLLYEQEPVFIRFQYKNFNDALIKDEPYVLPQKLVTSMIFDQKLNPFSRDFGLVFPGTTLTVLGFIALLLFFKRRRKEYHIFLYFGLFSFLTGMLYLLPTIRLPWFNMIPHVYWMVEHVLVKILLVFFIIMSANIFNAERNVIFRILVIILIILAFTDIPLFLLYPLPFHASIVLGIILMVFIVTSVIVGYRNIKDEQLIKKFIFLSMILMYLLAIGDVIISLFLPPTNVVLFGFGIVIYVFAMIYYLENEYIRNQSKAQIYFTELEFKKNENLRLKQESLRSQLNALKSQINPHFLFNTLNVLTSLIRVNPELSEKYVEQLSKIYRYILEFKSEELIMLNNELEFIQSYMFLLNIRFEKKLQVEIDPTLYQVEAKIPHLTLQMLIENAVKHNAFSVKSPLIIRIWIDDENNVNVINNLQPRTFKEGSTGTGLKNIAERYKLVSEKRPSFTTIGHEFVAKIPLI